MDVSPQKGQQYVIQALITLALVYAFLAGLHTVSDFDLGSRSALLRVVCAWRLRGALVAERIRVLRDHRPAFAAR